MLVSKLQFHRLIPALVPHASFFVVISTLAVISHFAVHKPERLGLPADHSNAFIETVAWFTPGLPFSAISALGGALAIFLSFRNSSAYGRWWEARKIWGALVNESRSWCRQVMAWTQGPKDDPHNPTLIQTTQRELIHRHLAFVHGLALHLRKQPELLSTVQSFVPKHERDLYANVPNIPTALLIQQGKHVAALRESGQIEHFRHLRMDDLLTRLSNVQGKCERIKNTPLPRQYDSIPRWFVYFYGVLLPFGLVNEIGWATIAITLSIMLVFTLLEASGRIIEDPFENLPSDTPMTALSITIERDLRAALGEDLPPAEQPNEDGVLM